MIRKYHNYNPQKNPWYRKEEPHNHHETPRRQTKQRNQLSLSHQDDRKTRMDKGNVQQVIEQLQTPTMGVTINNKSTTTEPPSKNGQQSKPPGVGGGLHVFYWYQILTLYIVIVAGNVQRMKHFSHSCNCIHLLVGWT